MRHQRFLLGLAAVSVVVGYLMWTGFTDGMVYYLTPVELMERVEADPSFRSVGVKVSGRVVEGSWVKGSIGDPHRFVVRDLLEDGARISVKYADVLPDTFNDEAEVVIEGHLKEDGSFEAHAVLTKCGSRYEAAEEELAA